MTRTPWGSCGSRKSCTGDRIAHPDTQVQAGRLPAAGVGAVFAERTAAVPLRTGEGAVLNPKLTVEPNIYNQEFFRIYEMAILRRTLVSASPRGPAGERPYHPSLPVPPRDLPCPCLRWIRHGTEGHAVPYSAGQQDLLLNEDLPGSCRGGDVVMACWWIRWAAAAGAGLHLRFPQFNDPSAAVPAWKSPRTKGAAPWRSGPPWSSASRPNTSGTSCRPSTPRESQDPIPVFATWGFRKDRIPPAFAGIKFKDAENIQDVDTMPDLRIGTWTWTISTGGKTIQGILLLGPTAAPGSSAHEGPAPAIVPVLESEFRIRHSLPR